MDFKGTRGKWEVFTDSYTNEITIYPSDSTVAICYMTNTYERNKYDALLISKAPEMLKMLENYLSDLKNIVPQSEARDNRINNVEQLIKEATEL